MDCDLQTDSHQAHCWEELICIGDNTGRSELSALNAPGGRDHPPVPMPPRSHPHGLANTHAAIEVLLSLVGTRAKASSQGRHQAPISRQHPNPRSSAFLPFPGSPPAHIPAGAGLVSRDPGSTPVSFSVTLAWDIRMHICLLCWGPNPGLGWAKMGRGCSRPGGLGPPSL